jgi:hypothetical protein
MTFEIGQKVTARQNGKEIHGTITGKHGTAEYYAVRLETGETIHQWGNDLTERVANVITQTSAEKTEEKQEGKTMNTTEKIIKWFEENEDVFNECMEQLDGYNGYLGDNRYYSMDDLDELHSGTELSEILRRAFYGYDKDNYSTDASGNRERGPFNPNRDYFRYNGYGNLVSTDYKDYSDQLDHYAIEAMCENRYYIDAIDENEELSAMFDELEAEQENE